MTTVTIYPGGTVEHRNGSDVWTFQAVVDGQAGLINLDLPKGASEREAAEAAKSLLEENPNELEGIA